MLPCVVGISVWLGGHLFPCNKQQNLFYVHTIYAIRHAEGVYLPADFVLFEMQLIHTTNQASSDCWMSYVSISYGVCAVFENCNVRIS